MKNKDNHLTNIYITSTWVLILIISIWTMGRGNYKLDVSVFEPLNFIYSMLILLVTLTVCNVPNLIGYFRNRETQKESYFKNYYRNAAWLLMVGISIYTMFVNTLNFTLMKIDVPGGIYNLVNISIVFLISSVPMLLKYYVKNRGVKNE